MEKGSEGLNTRKLTFCISMFSDDFQPCLGFSILISDNSNFIYYS
ncbi:unnamed protein product [Brassica rapa subsp. trilocularis]